MHVLDAYLQRRAQALNSDQNIILSVVNDCLVIVRSVRVRIPFLCHD